MILDVLQHSGRYASLHPGFGPAFEFLRRTDLASLPSGRHPIDGERLSAEEGLRLLGSHDLAALGRAADAVTPTVKVLGTLMRIFCRESAFLRSMLIVRGVRLRYW